MSIKQGERPMTEIDDIDVFDGMRWLIESGINLDDRAAIEQALPFLPYGDNETSKRYVSWCIKAAKANQARGYRGRSGEEGYVPPE
jgi:hypothetical protein